MFRRVGELESLVETKSWKCYVSNFQRGKGWKIRDYLFKDCFVLKGSLHICAH